jgi:hypothetical protein
LEKASSATIGQAQEQNIFDATGDRTSAHALGSGHWYQACMHDVMLYLHAHHH